MLMKRLLICLTAWAVLIVPSVPAAAKGPKFAKTEIEKAVGKCMGSILLGAFAGALVGAAVGGRRSVATGLAIGAGGGAVVCGILIANAKRRDRIIQAQMAAAMQPDRPYTASWADDDGQLVTFVARAGEPRTIDGARLMPTRYPGIDGSKKAAPVLDTGGRECRTVAGNFASGTHVAAAPGQLYCRTPDGDYQPYAEVNT